MNSQDAALLWVICLVTFWVVILKGEPDLLDALINRVNVVQEIVE